MTHATIQAQIDAAKAYEDLMVPALFGEWGPVVADAAHIQTGQRVLDVACGTGVLARGVLSRTGKAEFVTGLDPNAGMLEVARQLAPGVEWQQGLAESLPFPDATFDVVVSQFGLMFFHDRSEAIREALRVLKPGGRMAFAVWDSLENIPAYADAVALLERLAGAPAANAVRAPFVLGDRRDLEMLFAGAGFKSVEVATRKGVARFPSVRVMVEADLRGWLPVLGVVLTEEQIEGILQAAEHALQQYVSSDGAASFATSAHIVTGMKP
ncbi:methyltransferase domain-containing protein [Halomonas sp. TRM85114]|uniref:class I SAM-dependent methyltransferase n=1 Tax=Halomonas jincaotanensis TaxID=2810616 RepID=UPI001BD5EF7C|nr:methyltransferase domain-containing protein [Halomonas jincaotanensis]MBS9404412.1 methyltransferase domain-containing protein [Halomonas jincaotanensis]